MGKDSSTAAERRSKKVSVKRSLRVRVAGLSSLLVQSVKCFRCIVKPEFRGSYSTSSLECSGLAELSFRATFPKRKRRRAAALQGTVQSIFGVLRLGGAFFSCVAFLAESVDANPEIHV